MSPEHAGPNLGRTRTFAESDHFDTDDDFDSTAAPPVEPRRVSRFEIIRLLGQGGFGSVYLAHDPTLDREVAVKVPRQPGSWNSEQRARFLHEAKIAARMKHPHAVTVHEAGVCPEAGVYIVMEYIDGESLWERLRRGKLDVSDTVRLCGQVAGAIHEGHKLGLVHRDLKPGNILLDSHGNAKVGDFGLALQEDAQSSRRGDVSGTLPYMSPEQIRGEAHLLDGRSDVWSLGVILYECLAGRRPFRGDSTDALRDEILSRDPRPLRQIDDSIPESLDRLCRRCVCRDVSKRMSTALDFQQCFRLFSRVDLGAKWRGAVLVLAMVFCFLCGLASWAWPDLAPKSRSRSVPMHAMDDRDLLGGAPRPLLFDEDDPNSHFSYNEEMRRLTVASNDWSMFTCGTHPVEMELDMAMIHRARPLTAGFFWGLHSEAGKAGLTRQSCLAVLIWPSNDELNAAAVRLMRFTIGPAPTAPIWVRAIDQLAEFTIEVDWSAPIEMELKLANGKPRSLHVQGIAVPMSSTLPVPWGEHSTGQCGLMAFQQQVTFTKALRTTEISHAR